jgi:integrase
MIRGRPEMASIVARQAQSGRRYDVRYRRPDGTQGKKTFARKADAVAFASTVEADKLRGSFVDPRAGRVLFKGYAEKWLAALTCDQASREQIGKRLRVNVVPELGGRQLGQVRPSTVQAWLRTLDHLAPNTRTAVFATVSAVFAAAVDDELIVKNPCKASSVRTPKRVPGKVVPWPIDRVASIAAALPARYRLLVVLGAGLGLRQGEILGLSPDDIDTAAGEVHVNRQIKRYDAGGFVFAPPKGGKTRTVPLADVVSDEIEQHLDRFSAQAVTLPWIRPDGEPVTVPLLLTNEEHKFVDRDRFNDAVWHPALTAAGIPVLRTNGCHALRHHFASVLLDGGESIKALSEYLGHADPGFTLRTYTHLMPSSHERTRKAIDTAWTAGAMCVPSEAA